MRPSSWQEEAFLWSPLDTIIKMSFVDWPSPQIDGQFGANIN